MIAQGAGLLTIILAVWMWRAEKRRWLRVLSYASVGTVIAQGVLGGITVLYYLPPAVSSAHAALAQTYFCIAVAVAMFTAQRWVEEIPRVEFDHRRPSLFTLTLLSIFVLYVQLILGAMFRHHGLSWWPHVAHAVVVSFVLAWTAIRALTVYSDVRCGSASCHHPAVACDRAAVPRIHSVPDQSVVGPRRGATRASDGDFHGHPRCGWSSLAGDCRCPCDSGLATCSCRV